jgi:hypothetical protein
VPDLVHALSEGALRRRDDPLEKAELLEVVFRERDVVGLLEPFDVLGVSNAI